MPYIQNVVTIFIPVLIRASICLFRGKLMALPWEPESYYTLLLLCVKSLIFFSLKLWVLTCPPRLAVVASVCPVTICMIHTLLFYVLSVYQWIKNGGWIWCQNDPTSLLFLNMLSLFHYELNIWRCKASNWGGDIFKHLVPWMSKYKDKP